MASKILGIWEKNGIASALPWQIITILLTGTGFVTDLGYLSKVFIRP